MCQSCHRGLSRRDLLRGIALAGAVASTGMGPWSARRAVASDHEQVVLQTTVAGAGPRPGRGHDPSRGDDHGSTDTSDR
jgi:hypothetical protein